MVVFTFIGTTNPVPRRTQLAFFAEFLTATGVYESWVETSPLTYLSDIATHKRDALGTWFLSILAGYHRYAHITTFTLRRS